MIACNAVTPRSYATRSTEIVPPDPRSCAAAALSELPEDRCDVDDDGGAGGATMDQSLTSRTHGVCSSTVNLVYLHDCSLRYLQGSHAIVITAQSVSRVCLCFRRTKSPDTTF